VARVLLINNVQRGKTEIIAHLALTHFACCRCKPVLMHHAQFHFTLNRILNGIPSPDIQNTLYVTE